MIRTLPTGPRNRLAELILTALHDGRAREDLRRLAAGGARAGLDDWLGPDERGYAALLDERARRASLALGRRPLRSPRASLAQALDDAAALWDAGLFFEVHELLEPYWRDAAGDVREALQGLIQVAVGYQHLANGNTRGARALLEEGGARLHGVRLGTLAIEPFARSVLGSLDHVDMLDPSLIPGFPRASGE